jgi:5'-phosphate synthase pdxT subunit
MTLKIGVLALQGSFAEHCAVLQSLGVEAVQVRLPEQLDGLDGLIIPGGESTTIGKLAVQYHLMDALRSFGKKKPIWGTCAGAIFLSKDAQRDQPLLQLMHMRVARNAFGSQLDSFVEELDVPALNEPGESHRPFQAVFIRAPIIESLGAQAAALARLADGRIIAAREGRWLATCFHPELTGDTRFHRYFLQMAGMTKAEERMGIMNPR